MPLNFDYSRVWQWIVNSTTVAFGSESVNRHICITLSDIWLENIIDYYKEILMNYHLI